MFRFLIQAAIFGSACSGISQAAFSQVEKPISAQGPTLSGFFSDMAAWGAAHPAASIALAATAVMAVGMIVYNRIRA